MAKKRKSVENRLDEVDRNMYGTFCTAANTLSQLYSVAMCQQRHSFQAGQRHALEMLYQWIITQEVEGRTVNTRDIAAYLQVLQCLQEHPKTISSKLPILPLFRSGPFGPVAAVQGVCSGLVDYQIKNSVFSNALSNSVHQHLQQNHFLQGVMPLGTDPQCIDNSNPNIQNWETNSHTSNSMDMH